jgi:uncharacterized protein (DUF58 family)
MAVDYSLAVKPKNFLVDLTAPNLVYVGVPTEVAISLELDSPQELTCETFLEATSPLKRLDPIETFLKEGKAVVTLKILGQRRGLGKLEALWLGWGGPLGLIALKAKTPFSRDLAIAQNTRRLYQETLKFVSREAPLGVKPFPFRGEGSEFECLTDFVSGMDPRRVDWKRSGRHRKLLAREFSEERNNLIVFGFDTGRLSREPVGGVTKLDHFVASALRLAFVGLRAGDLVGACGYDIRFHSFLKPGRGPKHFARLETFTAALAYGLEETNHTLALAELTGRLPRRALIVLFTEFIDEVSAELLLDSLALLTQRHMVIFVTLVDPLLRSLSRDRPTNFQSLAAAVLADSFVKNREIVLNRVRRLGAHCLNATSADLTGALINRYLKIKRRGEL